MFDIKNGSGISKTDFYKKAKTILKVRDAIGGNLSLNWQLLFSKLRATKK